MTDRGKLINYNGLARIGSGGMSNVYRAVHPLLKRRVVIKELSDKLADDPLILERFTREAVTLAAMYHHNIIHVYDFWVTRKNRYIVMEYVDGRDLHKTIEDLGQIPPSIAVNIGWQILSALNYAHKKGIVHRDVKPHNVMISINGEVKLMDFGIVIKNEDKSLTRPGTIIGTPNYMSPEQVLGDTLDFSSDIFSFGVLMYEMLTGTLPFEEGADGSVFTKIRTFQHVSMRVINSRVPRVLCRIVDRCLNKDPKKRFKSTLEILNIFKTLLEREFKGLDVNEHLMKFLLEKDLYKSSFRGRSSVERTADFTQKVTRIVREREEEFRYWKRQEFFKMVGFRLAFLAILGMLGWGAYEFSSRYFRKADSGLVIVRKKGKSLIRSIKNSSKLKKRVKKSERSSKSSRKRKKRGM